MFIYYAGTAAAYTHASRHSSLDRWNARVDKGVRASRPVCMRMCLDCCCCCCCSKQAGRHASGNCVRSCIHQSILLTDPVPSHMHTHMPVLPTPMLLLSEHWCAREARSERRRRKQEAYRKRITCMCVCVSNDIRKTCLSADIVSHLCIPCMHAVHLRAIHASSSFCNEKLCIKKRVGLGYFFMYALCGYTLAVS